MPPQILRALTVTLRVVVLGAAVGILLSLELLEHLVKDSLEEMAEIQSHTAAAAEVRVRLVMPSMMRLTLAVAEMELLQVLLALAFIELVEAHPQTLLKQVVILAAKAEAELEITAPQRWQELHQLMAAQTLEEAVEHLAMAAQVS